MSANIREIRGIRGQSRFRRVTTSCQTTKKLKDSSTKMAGITRFGLGSFVFFVSFVV
jgi:hypothetical protein